MSEVRWGLLDCSAKCRLRLHFVPIVLIALSLCRKGLCDEPFNKDVDKEVRAGVCTEVGSELLCLPRSFVFESCQGPEQCSWAGGTMVCIHGQCQCGDEFRLTSDRLCAHREMSGPIRPMVYASLVFIFFSYVIVVVNIFLDSAERRRLAVLPSPTVIVNDQFDNKKFKRFNDQLDEALTTSLINMPTSAAVQEQRGRIGRTSGTQQPRPMVRVGRDTNRDKLPKCREPSKKQRTLSYPESAGNRSRCRGMTFRSLGIDCCTDNDNDGTANDAAAVPTGIRQKRYKMLVRLCTDRLIEKLADSQLFGCDLKARGDNGDGSLVASSTTNDSIYGTNTPPILRSMSQYDMDLLFHTMRSVVRHVMSENVSIPIPDLTSTKIEESSLTGTRNT